MKIVPWDEYMVSLFQSHATIGRMGDSSPRKRAPLHPFLGAK